jgi:hypothetical protein
MIPELKPVSYNYFEEVGGIVDAVKKLNHLKIAVDFRSDGMYVTEINSDNVRIDDVFYTARELIVYARGLEDGFWCGKLNVKPDLFIERD